MAKLGQNNAEFCSISCKKEGGFAVKISAFSHISLQPRDFPKSPFFLTIKFSKKHQIGHFKA
ncbi:MAG: hypothetical protein AMJ95_04025 [Omnitrophica WOR_2 bacterium SM23_72]|nr:MAG: hypothetical protein AMJ95_04025 [Omnitrophica WOR_2 bacterium SM23_72]